jgi:glycosyltransferase involved in cell wall biosynthesis
MRVAIDGQGVIGALTGASRGVLGVLERLRRDHPRDEYVVLSPRDRSRWRLPHQVAWDQAVFPWRARRAGADLLASPGMSGPLLRPRPLVLTVHDLAPTRHPEWLPTRRSRWYWGRFIPLTARHADVVIAPSESTRRDLVELAHVADGRVRVIPWGAPLPVREVPTAEVAAARRRHALDVPYVLYVGTVDRRKDLPALVRALALLPEPLALALAGPLIVGRTRVPDLVRELGLGPRVRFLGYVPDADLPGLYAGAAVFVYPSHYEGFGFPPLEAMACGTPVVSYNVTSLPEVIGDAGLLLDPPVAPPDLAKAIARVVEDQALRAELVARGRARVARFDWGAAARLTHEVYERVAGGPR